MAEPIWVTLAGAAVPTAAALLTVLLTRERSSGADHLKLTNCVRDVETLKTTVVTQATTLATHNLLHEQIGDRIEKTEDRLRKVETDAAQALGREQQRRHGA